MTNAFVAIHCETGKEGSVIRKLLELDGISEVTGILGLYDIIVKIESKDSIILEQIVTKNIRKIPHVLTTMTLIVI
jgi:DNA-binding Lrp family transcriptional regulator